jgi:16S rRNA (cytosine967-C5)-methyltransferase
MVLRRLGQLDALIEGCLAHPLPARVAMVRDLLRLGAAQLVFLRTPPHAAVHTTVVQAHERRCGPYAALINAVLRRLADKGQAMLAAQDAARLNTPGWLWQSWAAAFGEAVARSIAEAHMWEPPLDLTAKRADEAVELAERLNASRLFNSTLRLGHAGPVADLAGYDDGAWWVQDAAAALPAKLLGDVRGRRVLDLCAAPGGKTAQLAAAGADVLALDRSENRLRRLLENMDRLDLAVETVTADVLSWRPSSPVDRILLDAPCSSTGTIRRHPDVARLKTQADVESMARLQRQLLAAAAAMLAPGGILVYCVCSLQPEEGVAVVDSAIAAGLSLERVALVAADVAGYCEFLTSAGDMRTLPCHLPEAGGLDGFFAARLRRTAS